MFKNLHDYVNQSVIKKKNHINYIDVCEPLSTREREILKLNSCPFLFLLPHALLLP